MKMPDLATTDSEIRVVRWLIEPGQKIDRGQPLVEVETDKATMEVESVVTGALLEVRTPVETAVSVGQVIAVLEVEESLPPIVPVPTPTAAAPAAAPPPPRTSAAPGGMFARNRAAASPVAAGVPLSIAQRTAAKRLQESKQTIPHFYLQTSVNASAIIARRKAAEPEKLAWDAFLVLAAARAIGQFDRFRLRLVDERLVTLETDAIGVAIDHGGELYVVPIAAPAAKTVEQISSEIRGNVERLRGGDPEMRLLRPALMTVTNLGVCNVESFIPIINPPEPAILGVGKVRPTPVALPDGRIGIEPRSTITLCATTGSSAADTPATFSARSSKNWRSSHDGIRS